VIIVIPLHLRIRAADPVNVPDRRYRYPVQDIFLAGPAS
jgi:hypothetical protein